MYYQSRDTNYTNRFIGQVRRFIEEYSLFTPDEDVVIAVSGGIDSMVLLFVLHELRNYGYSNKVRVIHINHGTRSGQIEEAKLVEQFSLSLNYECVIEEFKNLNPHKNFEYRARLKRYEALYDLAQKNEKILLAHHIDDSFEWTMLQSLRSSSIEGLIGIPVVNDRVIRPFMSVTKAQIEKFATCYDLPYIEDPTNESMKYERNYIRHQVIPAFEKRYNKYLKHYVYRHNEIARRLGVHLLHRSSSHFKTYRSEDSVLIFGKDLSNDYSGIEQLVIEAVKHLHPNGRGALALQAQKIRQALEDHKLGPLNLVKNIKAYIDYNAILITAQQEPSLRLQFRDYKTFSYDEFHSYLYEWIDREGSYLDFPFIVVVKSSPFKKRNIVVSFNVSAVEELRSRGAEYYPALKLLREWSKKRNRHKVLRLNFLTDI